MVHRHSISGHKTSLAINRLNQFPGINCTPCLPPGNVFRAAFLSGCRKAFFPVLSVTIARAFPRTLSIFRIHGNSFRVSFSGEGIVPFPVVLFPLHRLYVMVFFVVNIILFAFLAEAIPISDTPLTLIFPYLFFCLCHKAPPFIINIESLIDKVKEILCQYQ
jgi:hypothetical protein